MTKEYEITVEEAQQLREKSNKDVSIYEALQRLYNNADFQLVFLENYVINEAVRNVGLLGDPTLNYDNNTKETAREDLHERMIGIARFSAYLRYVHAMGEQAKKSLDDLNEAEASYFSNV